jgi:hypothetical protein
MLICSIDSRRRGGFAGVGIDYFGHVVSVGMGAPRGSDRELVQVVRFNRLEQLSLNGTLVTDTGMRALEGLTHLKLLGLEGLKIGSSNLVPDAHGDHRRRFGAFEGIGRPAEGAPQSDQCHRHRGARFAAGQAGPGHHALIMILQSHLLIIKSAITPKWSDGNVLSGLASITY